MQKCAIRVDSPVVQEITDAIEDGRPERQAEVVVSKFLFRNRRDFYRT